MLAFQVEVFCALTPVFHYRARPLAQVADRNSKIWAPQPTRVALAFLCARFKIRGGRWAIFGRTGTDYLNRRISSYIRHWIHLKRPGIIVPLGVNNRVIHAWLRAFRKVVQRPTLVLVPPYPNTPWFRELFSHLPKVQIPFSERLFWFQETYMRKGVIRYYWGFVWEPLQSPS